MPSNESLHGRVSWLAKRLGYFLAALIMCAVSLLVGAAPATAYFNRPWWSSFYPVGAGSCSNTTSNATFGLQLNLWASNDLTDLSQVNGQDNSQTIVAIKQYQQRWGLTVDGCAGPVTWWKMQNYHSHLEYLGTYSAPAGATYEFAWTPGNGVGRYVTWDDGDCSGLWSALKYPNWKVINPEENPTPSCA